VKEWKMKGTGKKLFIKDSKSAYSLEEVLKKLADNFTSRKNPIFFSEIRLTHHSPHFVLQG
jgi:hypothetical protein